MQWCDGNSDTNNKKYTTWYIFISIPCIIMLEFAVLYKITMELRNGEWNMVSFNILHQETTTTQPWAALVVN